MKLALSEISTLNASFAEDVAAYAAAGFDAIGLWEFKLPDDDEANRALLRAHGLAVANCVPTVPSFLQLAIPGMEGPADPGERIDALCASIRRLAGYEPESVLCLSGPLGGRTEAEGRAIVVERAATCRPRRAGGRRPARVRADPPRSARIRGVRRLDGRRARAPRRGRCSTTSGSWPTPSTSPARRTADVVEAASRFTGLHVADEPQDPTPGVRVLPGEGHGRSAELVAALRATGWDGTLDVEIFSTPDAFWSLPVDEAARRAYAAAAALGAAGFDA